MLAKPNSQFRGVQIAAITYGISAIELMSNVAESHAGAPTPPAMTPPGPRQPPTPEQLEARRKYAEAVTQWRLSVPMAKYKAFGKLCADAGVKIYGFMMAHFAIGGLMHEAALKANEDPDRLSFLHAVRVVSSRNRRNFRGVKRKMNMRSHCLRSTFGRPSGFLSE